MDILPSNATHLYPLFRLLHNFTQNYYLDYMSAGDLLITTIVKTLANIKSPLFLQKHHPANQKSC